MGNELEQKGPHGWPSKLRYKCLLAHHDTRSISLHRQAVSRALMSCAFRAHCGMATEKILKTQPTQNTNCTPQEVDCMRKMFAFLIEVDDITSAVLLLQGGCLRLIQAWAWFWKLCKREAAWWLPPSLEEQLLPLETMRHPKTMFSETRA